MIKIDIKPISINECFQGRRFKTEKYKTFERNVFYSLPLLTIKNPPYRIFFEFGFSNSLSDWDNPIKPIQDILQTKYKFNDRDIFEAIVRKIIVKKGNEYFKFKIESIK